MKKKIVIAICTVLVLVFIIALSVSVNNNLNEIEQETTTEPLEVVHSGGDKSIKITEGTLYDVITSVDPNATLYNHIEKGEMIGTLTISINPNGKDLVSIFSDYCEKVKRIVEQFQWNIIDAGKYKKILLKFSEEEYVYGMPDFFVCTIDLTPENETYVLLKESLDHAVSTLSFVDDPEKADEKMRQAITDSGLYDIALDSLETRQWQENRENYIASCGTYSFTQIARYPNEYKGKQAAFTGEVIQSQRVRGEYQLRVNITKSDSGIYSDTIYITYTPRSDDEPKILEDDIITAYGMLNGEKTYQSIGGGSVTIPFLKGEYIDVLTE